MRYAGVLISGLLGGLGGIVYITAGVSTWKFENGVAGFGFLALAVMIFGAWHPLKIALAALLFGLFRALGNVYSGLDLLEMPMILREPNSGTRQEMERYLRNLQITPEDLNIIAQIDNPEAIRSSVSRGLGVSIMSVLAAREYLLSERLLSFELGSQGAFRKIYLAWRKDVLLSPAEQKFRDFVQSRPLLPSGE